MVVAMTPLERSIADRKRELDRLRPLSQEAPRQLQTHQDVELTYTSNAIEGNALTLRETAEVIEHGITVGGKPLRDHLEALDQYEAVLWVREIASAATPVGEATVVELHRRIVARSQPSIADAYSSPARRVAGSAVVFPNPAKIPDLMEAFGAWLARADASHVAAFEAHFQLATIHPFSDGNGRRARLLMNLMLVRGGYPPIPIRPEDRASYLAALEKGQLGEDIAAFQAFMAVRLNEVMGEYLRLLAESIVPPSGLPEPQGHAVALADRRVFRRVVVGGGGLALGVGAQGRRQGPDAERMVLVVLGIGVDLALRGQPEAGLLHRANSQAVAT